MFDFLVVGKLLEIIFFGVFYRKSFVFIGYAQGVYAF